MFGGVRQALVISDFGPRGVGVGVQSLQVWGWLGFRARAL